MGLFEWGEKRFSRGIAKAMIRSYKLYKSTYPNLEEHELVLKTLSDRPGRAASQLYKDISNIDFFTEIGGNLFNTIYVLVLMEYAEYMRGEFGEVNNPTNLLFKETILDEIRKNQIMK